MTVGGALKIDVRVEATASERRRLLGGADITPMIELVSLMLDSVMMVVVRARLETLSDDAMDDERLDRP